MSKILIDSLGWFGVATYLIAYALVSTKKLEGDSILYQAMNLVGGVTLTINALNYHALPSVGINLAWIGIAVFTLSRKRLSGDCHDKRHLDTDHTENHGKSTDF